MRRDKRMTSERSQFILVVSRLDYGDYALMPEEIFEALRARSVWLLSQHASHRRMMAPDDRVVFYFAGNKRRHFVADAEIAAAPRPMTAEEAAFAEKVGLKYFDYALPLTNIRRWSTPAPIAPLYDDLAFIKDKRYPGHQLRQGVVRISEPDYLTILAQVQGPALRPSSCRHRRT